MRGSKVGEIFKVALGTCPKARFAPAFGAPVPVLAPQDQAQLALWCAEWIRPTVKAEITRDFASALEEARWFAANPSAPEPPWRGGVGGWPPQFTIANDRSPAERQQIAVACFALIAAIDVHKNPQRALVIVCQSVRFVAAFEQASSGGDLLLAEHRFACFLRALEDESLRLEAEATIRERAGLDVKVASVLWRGAERYRVTSIVVRLAGSARRYGALALARKHWRWVAGTRDEVLASLPMTVGETAALSARERDCNDAAPSSETSALDPPRS